MKVDIYRTKNPAGFLFVPHGSELPASVKRPDGAAVKPWKTTDLSKSGERNGLSEAERLAVLSTMAEHGQAMVTAPPKAKRQPKA